MRWKRRTLINGFNVTYQEHPNEQGTHRIGHMNGSFVVKPDGLKSAKSRYMAICQALQANDTFNGAWRQLYPMVGPWKPASDEDVILFLLQQGPACGTDINQVRQMNRYAARIHSLRDWFEIESRRCGRHEHRGSSVEYILHHD